MPDPKEPVAPAAVPEQEPAAPKADLSDQDLESVSGGFGHASLPQAQLNIGQSLAHEGRSVVSSIGNPVIAPDKINKP